ncbi:two-component system sensor histidine kinase MtrB [Rarobacter faecitabidus]|uniref:Sensor histidine kinase MtrB n=1 Tax=Rarobacter faecitabidus TaxID=13243 RepID=A0A542ZU90_RARFA|nr:two-component system sensor histidine kinase MtrB [Rarobacter faecitabidus]
MRDRARIPVLRRFLASWRSSLQAKVLASVLAMTLISLAVVTALMSSTIRDGIVNQRRQSVLTESARSITGVRALLNSSAASNSTQIQQLLQDTIGTLQSGAGGQRDVFLWRMREQPTPQITVNDVSSDPDLGGLITPELRAAVARDAESAHWQSIAIADGDSMLPGMVVGAAIEVPVAGTFELYLMYSLDAEQRTLTFIQRVLIVSIAALTGVLVLITWLVTRQVVRPIVAVSSAAERIADGHLDERLPVRGSDEVAALESSFNAMAASLQDQIERLAHLSALQRRFVSDVSHELRTPLTTVRMAVDLLHDERDEFPRATRRSVELLKDQIDRFESLLTDLLEISRFDAGAAHLDVDARDVASMVRGIIEGMMPLADNEGVVIELKTPLDRVVCELDTVRFERIIRNLLANAIEHAEGKPVEVEIAQTTSAIAVRVRDHGVGLSESDLTHVFDRFWRGDPARARTTGGTGLGLSISLEDALLHNGRLEVAGAPGEGATFLLTLPKNSATPILDAPLLVRDPAPEPLRYDTIISLEDVVIPHDDVQPQGGNE